MFIREVIKRNRNSDKLYSEFRLVKSYREGDKTGQIVIMTMPDIRVSKEQWKALADAIEGMISGQNVLFNNKALQAESERWFDAYVSKKGKISAPFELKDKEESDFACISLSSIKNRHPKSIGVEYISLSMYRELGFDAIFSELGFSAQQKNVATLSILGRTIEPGSENATVAWARAHTGLGELLGTDFSKLSHNALYRITDQIYQHKEHIEQKLREHECEIFNLEENIFLYDLTNTYLEGQAAQNPKAKFGRSKEKRKDCRLLTLGLVLDELGFPKRSKVMEGSVSEGNTLKEMIAHLNKVEDCTKPVTVVMDAGIAKQENLDYLRNNNMHYICVARNKPIPPDLIDKAQFIPIANKGNNKITAQMFRQDNECVLYCESEKMGLKEEAMQEKFCARFEEALRDINKSLSSKNGRKKFDAVQERVIRLKERYNSISRFYTINIDQIDGKATEVRYICDQNEINRKFSGSYFLRTSLMELDSNQIWAIYMMLNTVESAFRTLKSDLDLRPVFHQKESRAEAHLFIAVLAYHIVIALRNRLKENSITISWDTLRKMMRNHQIIQTTMLNRKGTHISIIDSTVAEDNHKQIYKALNLSYNPVKRKVSKFKVV